MAAPMPPHGDEIRLAATSRGDEKLLVTIPEACEILSIGRTHIYRLHRLGYFDFVRLGKSTRIRCADLRRLAGVES
jgi:excisionase family DNA binding protein